MENKFSYYLLYANDEVVLVVIGILIALQVNNWNEVLNRQQRVNPNTGIKYVRYPNSNVFGKWAWNCMTLASAEERLNKLKFSNSYPEILRG